MAPQVRGGIDEPSPALLALSPGLTKALDSGGGERSQKFLQLRLEHAALRVDVGIQLVDAATQLALELGEPLFVLGRNFQLALLEVGGSFREAPLEPLRARVADPCASRSASTVSASRAKLLTDRSSSRARRFAASSRAVFTAPANCCDASAE